MKGKRYSTEEKVRILRDVDGGKSIVENLPGEEHLGCDVPPLAETIRSYEPERGQAAEGPREGKHRAEKNAGRRDVG